MEILNQLAAPLAQSAAVAKQQTTEKSQQIRHSQSLRKNIAASPDTFEHQVESAEKLAPIHDKPREEHPPAEQHKRPAPKEPPPEEPPHLDVTA